MLRPIFAALAVLLACALARAEPEVTLSVAQSKSGGLPGDQLVVAVILDHAEDTHTQGNQQEQEVHGGALAAFPTVVDPRPTGDAAKALQLGPTQWPKTILVSAAALGDPKGKIPMYEGRAVIYVPVVIAPTATPGDVTLPVAVKYQACDDSICIFPVKETVNVSIKVLAPGETATSFPGGADQADFTAFDQSIFAKMLAGTVKPATAKNAVTFNFFGKSFAIDAAGAGLVLLLLLAFAGGFLLNLTPCVLPVIPIKIMGLQSHGEKRIVLGLVMFLGVVAFWMGLGGAISFFASFKAINQLFQYPAFSLSVGVFILIMAISMLGVFTVNLPQWVYMIDPKRETLFGSFVFGVMTAVLSTPCTAPFMGAASAWAATQPTIVTLATFGAIGLGMGLPYFVLAVFPGLVSFIPRTGKASEVLKQVLGILMLAVATFFIGTGIDPLLRLPVDPPIRWHWWIVGGFVVLAGLWTAYWAIKLAKKPIARGGWSLVGLAIAAAGAWLGVNLSSHGPIDWVGYTPERLAEAHTKGQIVVLDFTAEWCFNCKALEEGVLHQRAIVDLFKRGDAIPMRVDLTGDNKPGSAKLKELNWVGIPLLAIYGPGAKDPIKFDTYTPQTVLDAIAKARGTTAKGL